MTDALFDIADRSEEITIGRSNFQLRGISFRSWAALASRFPVLRDLLSGQSVSWESVATVAPDLVMAVLAAGCGELGNAQVEAFFDALPLPMQYDIGERIWRLSFPEGFGPFVEKFQRFAAALGVDASVEGGDLGSVIERLIAGGHPPTVVWGYTPRQALAFARLAQARLTYDAALALSIATLAARGNSMAIQRQIREWTR